MRKILYIDMDGVINLFENDPDARMNMWQQGYFTNIEPRENIKTDLLRILDYVDEIIILTKCIDREGVREEKEKFIHKYLSGVDKLSIVFVPYNDSKSNYIDKDVFSILLDDGIRNIKECEQYCNICILFDENNKYQYKNKIKRICDIINFMR